MFDAAKTTSRLTRSASSFAAALLIFGIVNFCVSKSALSAQENNLWWNTARSSIDQIDERNNNPNLIFMGSSMMRYPIWEADKQFEPSTPPFGDYHATVYFEHLAKLDKLTNVKGINIAVDGSSISDNLLLFSRILSRNHKPALVIWGISPRDFTANWFFSEITTPIFQLTCGPREFLSIGTYLTTNATEWIDGFIRSTLPLVRQARPAIGLFVHKNVSVTKDEQNLPETPEQATHQNEADQRRRALNLFVSTDKNSKLAHYKNQKLCLQALLKLAKEHGVQVLLVDMPVQSQLSVNIPQTVLDDYAVFLHQLKTKGIKILFLRDQSQAFGASDFIDGVHLNGNGGAKLLASIAHRITEDKELSEKLKLN
jgi:hypothetical protein